MAASSSSQRQRLAHRRGSSMLVVPLVRVCSASPRVQVMLILALGSLSSTSMVQCPPSHLSKSVDGLKSGIHNLKEAEEAGGSYICLPKWCKWQGTRSKQRPSRRFI